MNYACHFLHVCVCVCEVLLVTSVLFSFTMGRFVPTISKILIKGSSVNDFLYHFLSIIFYPRKVNLRLQISGLSCLCFIFLERSVSDTVKYRRLVWNHKHSHWGIMDVKHFVYTCQDCEYFTVIHLVNLSMQSGLIVISLMMTYMISCTTLWKL